MVKGLSSRRSRAIRIGINARCLPYHTGGNDDEGYYTVLDFTRLRTFSMDWERFGKSNPLSRRAYERTAPWTSQHREEAAK